MSKIKGHPGLFWPSYKDKDGKKRESRKSIWGSYWCKGCPKHPERGPHQESLGTNLVKQAAINLAKLKTHPKRSLPDADDMTVSWLLDSYLDNASTTCKRSTLKEYEDLIRVHLRPALGFYRALDLIYDRRIIERFIASKQNAQPGEKKKGYSQSRIGAMLTLLTGAYRNAHRELGGMQPQIKKRKNVDVRNEYFSDVETERVLSHLPPEIVRPLRVLDITGWRSWSEIFSRKQDHLQLKRGPRGALILEPYSTKNNEPRIFPLNDELRAIFEEQRMATEKFQKQKNTTVQWLFHDPDGNPLANYYETRDCWKPSSFFKKHWKKALKAAGLSGRRIHDYRRSGIRRYRDAGIDDAVGMVLSGHKSLRIYHAYKAVQETDLFKAVEKISDFKKKKRKRKTKIHTKRDTTQ